MSSQVLRELAGLIEVTSGFVIRESGFVALGSYAEERAHDLDLAGLDGYLEELRRHPESAEWRRLLSRITIKESYLFRGQAQLEILRSTVIPELVKHACDHRLRVWCAGCARGEEAATLAMVFADHPALVDKSWEILATDVDDAALAEARLGRYGRRAVARVSPEHMDRFFVESGGQYELDRELLACIRYQHLNLVDGISHLAAGSFDLIFLRNVLIYFRTKVQRSVIAGVERTLAHSGFLFLGPSESLLHLGCNLEAHDLGSCFCYRLPGAIETPKKKKYDWRGLKGDRPGVAHTVVRRPELPSSGDESGLTLEGRLDRVIAAFESDGAAGALALIGDLRKDYPESAVLHALEAVARERTGDLDAAVFGYRAALYLAPEISEIRFLLARALQALGRTRGAIREYRAVLTGLGPASEDVASVLGRLDLPMPDRMIEISREELHELESESQN